MSKVLVVGGGIAGMCCAIQLRKIGVEVHLVDNDPHWRSYGAGITITGPTLRAFQTIGVLDEVVSQGATWNKAKIHNQAGDFLTSFDQQPLAEGLPATGGILRPVLHQILSGKTADCGVPVKLGVSVSNITDTGDHVDVTLSDGSSDRYDLAVGADGIFSKTREQIFPGADGPTPTGQVIFRLLAQRPPGFDCTHFFMGRDIKIGFNPVSRTHMYMFLLQRAAPDPWIAPEHQPQALYASMAGFGGFVPDIRETVLTFNAYSVNYRPLEVILLPEPWYRGRVVLIGDASHATTPHLASGAGMAIEDGIVLTEELERSDCIEQALVRFTARRYQRCRLVIENSVEIGRLEMTHGAQATHIQLMNDTFSLLREPI